MFKNFLAQYAPLILNYSDLNSDDYLQFDTSDTQFNYPQFTQVPTSLFSVEIPQQTQQQVQQTKEDQPTESKPKIKTEVETPNDTLVASSSQLQKMINYAKQQIGKRYETGTHGPNSFDCSGFAYSVYKAGGINIPLNIFKMSKYGREVSVGEAKPGDITVSKGSGKSGLHIRFITEVKNGKIKVIEAAGKKTGVRERWLSDSDIKGIKSIRRMFDFKKRGGKLIPRYRYIK